MRRQAGGKGTRFHLALTVLHSRNIMEALIVYFDDQPVCRSIGLLIQEVLRVEAECSAAWRERRMKSFPSAAAFFPSWPSATALPE
jgi:hypothetical protein